MNIAQLNNSFSIPDQLTFVEGRGGLPMIEVQNTRMRALISIYAGQVLSFHPSGESEDLLFNTGNAFYEEGKAIKGGIPICWPWFGPDPEGRGRAAHGIARTRLWRVLDARLTETEDIQVILVLEDNAETRAVWPYHFRLTMEITLGDTLTVCLRTLNTDDQTFAITQALHSYFRLGAITQTRLSGLSDSLYIDKLYEGRKKTQQGDVVVAEEVDRVYLGSPAEMLINDEILNRKIVIRAEGHQTVVVWNPWKETCAKMQDLADEDYQRFLCVEISNASDDVVEIPAGEEYCLTASYGVER